MSAYAHQMEREFSGQSLSSRGGSEMGSHYEAELGIYMTSFAATIFIVALLTAGMLLIALLISLTVMLQSCQEKNTGVVELRNSRDDYRYCEIFALHAELNSLGTDYTPAICKEVGIQYIREGWYMRDLNTTMWMAESYFGSIQPLDDDLDVVLMDVDDLFPSNCHFNDSLLTRLNQHSINGYFEQAMYLKQTFILNFYNKLQAAGWPLILISRKSEKERHVILKHLTSAGYAGWSSLIMRSDDEVNMDSWEYLSKRRTEMQKNGFRIMAIISSQMDALSGSCLGKRIFKLPNSVYYSMMMPCTKGQIGDNILLPENKNSNVS